MIPSLYPVALSNQVAKLTILNRIRILQAERVKGDKSGQMRSFDSQLRKDKFAMTKRTSISRRTNQQTNDTFYVRFFALISQDSVSMLMQIVDQKLAAGAKKLGLLISTPGGNVFNGLSAYNYLRGCPLEITTHNFGSADSIGVVLFCAGSRRLSVPHARFLLHGVTIGFQNHARLEEKQLEERLKSLHIDTGNIARVIADATGKDPKQIHTDMLDRTALYPEEAIEYGLVDEIRSELFPPGAEVISIPQSV